MDFLKIGFVAVLLGGLLACSAGVDQQSATINGMPALDYYKQFIYKSSTKSESTNYFFLEPVFGSILKREGGGKTINGKVALFLFDQFKFTLIYDEDLGCSKNGASSSYVIFHKPITGTWDVLGVKLLIGDLAQGDGIQYNGQSGVELKFLKDINQSGLTEHVPLLLYRPDNMSLEKMIQNPPVLSYEEASSLLDQHRSCGVGG